MGGGSRGRRQTAAETTAGQAATTERQQAGALSSELAQRKTAFGAGLPETMEATRTSAQNLADTGGFRPEELAPIQSGYGELATTGGFTPEQSNQFLRRASAPVTAMYGAAQDQLERQKSLQGGYSPGFDASRDRLMRRTAQGGAEASLAGNVELANQVRQGKVAGLGGLQQTAEAVQRGRIAGQDALQRYSQFGVNAINDTDVLDLRNRLQSGQLSMADSQLLAALAAQDKTMFDKIMEGIKTVGGAAAGVLAAV